MVEVIPAIMPKSFSDLREKVLLVAPYVSFVQIDPMDGRFVPEKTWPYLVPNDPDFTALLSEKIGLPEWEKIDYEIDLMSDAPRLDAFDWIRAGAKRVILHIESSRDTAEIIADIRKEFGTPKDSPTAPEIGIAASNDTPVSSWKNIIPHVDFVQCMGIAKIGYQGQPFDERVLGRIKTLRDEYPALPISVDGAVNGETAPHLVEAGATRLASGSYIFKSSTIKETIEYLRNL